MFGRVDLLDESLDHLHSPIEQSDHLCELVFDAAYFDLSFIDQTGKFILELVNPSLVATCALNPLFSEFKHLSLEPLIELKVKLLSALLQSDDLLFYSCCRNSLALLLHHLNLLK